MTQRTGTAGTIRWVASTAAAVLAATALAGCAGTDGAGGSAAPAPSPSVSPKSALLAAVPDEKDPAFRFSGSDLTGKVSGMVDPAAGGMELTVAEKVAELKSTMSLSFRVIGQQAWMRVTFDGKQDINALLKLPKRWMALDNAKIEDPADAPVYEGTDPGNTATIIRTAETVEEKGDGTYVGTVDLTKGQDVATAMEGLDIAALGDAAKQVPFTAVVGADGNLTSLTLDIPAAGKQKASKYVVRYFDFGKAPKLAAPTGSDVQKAPATAYELLNS
ncbi:hypothetical protein NCC78_09985 [Micromonospora phytophila]|uniref:hypothetical protein n=1 Tax=Micromonospora phytophila TaxID=709888 RepID=UPI00202E0C33|nr:hypothetical protein [Micromonospora phytophila]MCM0675016.1 hypothetical protein [Micromonospora phytophila]